MFAMKQFLSFLLILAPFGLFAQKSLTLDDCFTFYRFYPDYGEAIYFSPDGQHFCKHEDGALSEYSLASGELSSILLRDSDLKGLDNFDDFVLASDMSFVLLRSQSEPVYRHSVLADYYVYHFKTGKTEKLFDGRVQYTAISPDNQAIAFVANNNLYYKELQNNRVVQVTRDGAQGRIINGVADWLYEEEFSSVSGDGMAALRWSPDGDKIAFIRFDETRVPQFTMNQYTGDAYPVQNAFKYPKVGEKNAELSVKLYDLVDRKTLSVMGLEKDDYVPRLHWTSDNRLVITRLNRRQDTLELLIALPGRAIFDDQDETTYMPVRPLLMETNPAYVELHDHLYFLQTQKRFIWTSEQQGYNHIYAYSLNPEEGEKPTPLTSGNFDVTSFYGLDEKTGRFYFQTATPTPMDRQVWEGYLNGNASKLLTPKPGWWEASFSPDYSFYRLSWSDANNPPEVNLHHRDSSGSRSLVDNTHILEARKNYGLVEKKFWKFRLPDGTELNGWMLKPDSITPGKKYPVLFDVYGGPGSQTVQNQYDGYLDAWRQMLVQKGIIVVSVDNRGTGARGQAFKKCTQLQLGRLETEDQIAAARFLGSMPFVDPGRIGIWGWSFGGYLSTSCLLKGNEVFSMAMAVAPVVNWKWYDSAYTERYMRTLADNQKGYEENSPIFFVDKMRGQYLICHGIADDNVHWQHTVEMINALIKAGKSFETVYYPNRNHGIYTDNANMHLFTKLTNFILEKL